MKPSLDDLPDFPVVEEEDSAYLAKVEQVWSELDKIHQHLLNELNDDLRVAGKILEELEVRFRRVDDFIEMEIGHPSPQFQPMDRMISSYCLVLSGAFTWIKGKDDVPEVRRRRWLQQNLDELRGYSHGFKPLRKALLG